MLGLGVVVNCLEFLRHSLRAINKQVLKGGLGRDRMRRLWAWLWVLVAVVVAEELGSTQELYRRLRSTDLYTFVYVFSQGCADLDAQFEQLTLLLQSDGEPLVGFATIESRRSRNLARDFNIESFPQLLLFRPQAPQEGPLRCTMDLLEDVYHGANTCVEMANYLWRKLGHLPQWTRPGGAVTELSSSQALQSLGTEFNEYWKSSLALGTFRGSSKAVVLIAFVTPWTRTEYQDLFLSGMPDSLVDRLSAKHGSQVRFVRLDASLETMAPVVNAFRVSTVPSVFLLLQDDVWDSRLALLELMPYDAQTWNSAPKVLSQLLDAATSRNSSMLRNLAREYHSINLYESLQDRQQEVLDERDDCLARASDDEIIADSVLSSIWNM